VLLRLRHFISSVVVILLAGGLPYFVCTPNVCAANKDCAVVHCCNCCGANCPMQKSSQETRKHGTGCNQHCPLISAGETIAISNVNPLPAAMSGVTVIQPFLFAHINSYAFPARPSATSHPPTLLSLSCALTI
jgi:hypothetical protein